MQQPSARDGMAHQSLQSVPDGQLDQAVDLGYRIALFATASLFARPNEAFDEAQRSGTGGWTGRTRRRR
jgi:hypothetical protein